MFLQVNVSKKKLAENGNYVIKVVVLMYSIFYGLFH